MLSLQDGTFVTLVEVVPPQGGDVRPLLDKLDRIRDLPIDAFSVASNPVAKRRMSALAVAALVEARTGVRAIMHGTTRDHNRLSAWSNLCGAKALGIETVLLATGDFVALGDRASTTTVRDVDVLDLVEMARHIGLQVGVVFDPGDDPGGTDRQVQRLRSKAAAGAQFGVTQPVYDTPTAETLAGALASVPIPIIMGILPLRSARHARFLHDRVAGIHVPPIVQHRVATATDPVAEGIDGAQRMMVQARRLFAGACIMPPFGHYEVVAAILD